ncbi:MAG: C69 family dipeptidase [Candidatus Kapabacteria bacterium]|nr:C69 family dipeptidase [Candidatus Kapabacteria bacterium]
MYKILTLLFLFSISLVDSNACTNFLVTKGASINGSSMITYAADAGGFMEPLHFTPAKDWAEGELLIINDWDSGKYLGKIKQIKHTYSVVGNMNEWQVSIGETTFGGLDSLRDTTGIIDYGSLMYLVLQRAKTAKEGIKIIEELTSEYGYFSSGESFSIADPNEVWIVDVIGKGNGKKGVNYVARRIPDGYIAAHANQSRIREILFDDPDNCMYSKDIIEFTKKKGIYKEYKGKFSFADTFNPIDIESALFCEGRVWRFYTLAAPNQNLKDDYFRAVEGAEPYPLFVKPDKKISVKDLQNWMRDHFEGTPYDMTKGLGAGPYGCPYRWKGLEWKMKGDTVNKYAWERPISTQQTAFSFIAQMRSDMPREIAGVLWYGVDDAATSCYIPLYSCLGVAPKCFVGGSIREFDWNSAWWVFNLVANKSYSKYKYISEDIKKVQSYFEDKFLTMQPYIEKTALDIYKQDPKMAIMYLTDYSVSQSEQVTERWKELWKYITVKYNDGYINDVNVNNGRTPKGVGYDNDFLKQVIESRPGYFDVKWRKKNELNN